MSKHLPEEFAAMCDLRSNTGATINTELLRQLKYSALAGTCKIFKDQFERRTGYIAWANINRESLQKIKRSGRFPSFSYEWDEGYITLVLDMAGSLRHRDIKHELRRNFSSHRAIAFINKNRLRLYVRKRGLFRSVDIVSIDKSNHAAESFS